MSPFGLVAHSAVPLGLIVLSHSWSAEITEVKAMIVRVPAAHSPASGGAAHNRPVSEPLQRQDAKRKRYRPGVTPGVARGSDHQGNLIVLAAAREFLPRAGALRTFDGSAPTLRSNSTETLMAAILAAAAPVSKAPAKPATSAEQETPSVLRMLEGREQDLLMTAGIAVAFFLFGWLCGGIYHVRRERTRQTKLRF